MVFGRFERCGPSIKTPLNVSLVIYIRALFFNSDIHNRLKEMLEETTVSD